MVYCSGVPQTTSLSILRNITFFSMCGPYWTQACSHVLGYIPGPLGPTICYSPNTYPGVAILPPIHFFREKNKRQK